MIVHQRILLASMVAAAVPALFAAPLCKGSSSGDPEKDSTARIPTSMVPFGEGHRAKVPARTARGGNHGSLSRKVRGE